MITIHILRTEGNKDYTLGKMWIDGDPQFRARVKEKPSPEFSKKRDTASALHAGTYPLRLAMNGLIREPRLHHAGKYFFGVVTDDRSVKFEDMPLGSIQMITPEASHVKLAELLSEYLEMQMLNGRMTHPKPRRGEFQLVIEYDKDFVYYKADEQEPTSPFRDNYDFDDWDDEEEDDVIY